VSEEVGFEPTVPCGTPVFKTGAFGHSATLPYEMNEYRSKRNLYMIYHYSVKHFVMQNASFLNTSHKSPQKKDDRSHLTIAPESENEIHVDKFFDATTHV
jgi:hypothetical protein